MTLNVVGWLIDAGTEHERTLAGAAWVPSRGGTTNEPLVLRVDAEAEIARLRHDAELFAWVLSHPETVAECLQDAAAGDGTARDNIEFRRDALTPNV